MLRAAKDAARQTAAQEGCAVPLVVAVTVLTSLDDRALSELGVNARAPAHVETLARLAQKAGLDGVVASPQEAASLRRDCGRDFVIVTPGIRSGGAEEPRDDQRRTLTARDAIAAGASYVVVGRPVTGAPDPRAAAEKIAAEASA